MTSLNTARIFYISSSLSRNRKNTFNVSSEATKVAMHAKYFPSSQKWPFNGCHDETKTRYHDTRTRSHRGNAQWPSRCAYHKSIISVASVSQRDFLDADAVVIFLFVVAAWPPRVTGTTERADAALSRIMHKRTLAIR